MRKCNKILSALLAVMLLTTLFSVTAFADGGNTTLTAKVPCTVTLGIGENGSVTVDGTKYTGDTSFQKDLDTVVSYSITPDSGYEINSVLYNGVNVTASVSGGVYTAPALTNNATLTILFASTAHVHEWDEDYTVDKEPTCTEEGSKSIHCKGCDEVKDVTPIPAKGHNFGEWETVTSPTCTDSGSEKRVCSVCGFTETRNIDPNGHEWEEDYTVDKEPTCTVDGSKSIHCKHCDAVKDSTVIPALGHAWDGGVVIKEATATQSGLIKYTCTRCGEVRYVTIPPTSKHPDHGDGGYIVNYVASRFPKTGDESHVALWIALLCASGAGIAALMISKRKRKAK